jgi:transcriptional regulator with PAS, ATPase and Fis domain
VPRTEAQIIEEAAQVIQLRREMPDVSDLAAELGVSRQTLYNRVDAYLKEKAGSPTTGNPAQSINTEAA